MKTTSQVSTPSASEATNKRTCQRCAYVSLMQERMEPVEQTSSNVNDNREHTQTSDLLGQFDCGKFITL